MPQVIIPTLLSNAQREELLGAITLRAGGKIHLAEPNHNRFALERPSLPLHIYQGNEDVLSFARESNVDILSIAPGETRLGAIQQITDASVFVETVHQWLNAHQNAEHANSYALVSGIAAEISEKFHSNSEFPLQTLLPILVEHAPALSADIKTLCAFPDHANAIERLPQQLWQLLTKTGYRVTLDPEKLQPTPSQGVSILSTPSGDVLTVSKSHQGFAELARQLHANKVPEKVFMQTLHQFAAQQGVSIEVGSQAMDSAYPITMIRPSSMAALRQIYASSPGADFDNLMSKLVFVHKPVLVNRVVTSEPTVDRVLSEANVLLKRQVMELQTMLQDGLQRARLQQIPDVKLVQYSETFARVKETLLGNDGTLESRINALDVLREFVVNGGLYSPENKRDELFVRATALIERALFEQPGDADSRLDANRKQSAWKSAYDALLADIPEEHQRDFANTVAQHWDIVCPQGEFPLEQKIPEMAKSYARLLKDVPTQFNREIEKTLHGMVNQVVESADALQHYPAVLEKHPVVTADLNEEISRLREVAASFSHLPTDDKPIGLYNALKANIEVLRLCAVQYERVMGFYQETLSEVMELAQQDAPKVPFQLNISKLPEGLVPAEFTETLRRTIDVCENCEPHALTVLEFVDALRTNFKEEVAFENITLPADFDIENALLAMQSSGALVVVESLEARKRQADESKRSLLELNKQSVSEDAGIWTQNLTPEQKSAYSNMMQELSFLISSLESVQLESSPGANEIERQRIIRDLNAKIEQQWQQIKQLESDVANRKTSPAPDKNLVQIPAAHSMLRDAWVTANLMAGPYAEALKEDPELYNGQKTEFEQVWVENLKTHAKNDRISDAVLDDYVAHYGMTAMQSVFRGVYEQGVAGYVPLLERNRPQTSEKKSPTPARTEQPRIKKSDAGREEQAAKEDTLSVNDAPKPVENATLATPQVEKKEVSQFSDHSDLSEDPVKRPLMLEADGILEQASVYMYKEDELILADEENFLMNAFDRLFGDDTVSVEQLQANLEEFKHLVSPIDGVKARTMINNWYLHAYDVNEVTEKIAAQTAEIWLQHFPEVEADFRYMALLSPSFRDVSAGVNMFILQSTAESTLTRLKSSFKEELERAIQPLALKTPEGIVEWLHALREYQCARAEIRQFALSDPAYDKAAGHCWKSALAGKSFGSDEFLQSVKDVRSLINDPAAVEVLREQLHDMPDVKGYLVLSCECPEVVEQPVKKQRATRARNSDFDFSEPSYGDDENELSLRESVSAGRMKI